MHKHLQLFFANTFIAILKIVYRPYHKVSRCHCSYHAVIGQFCATKKRFIYFTSNDKQLKKAKNTVCPDWCKLCFKISWHYKNYLYQAFSKKSAPVITFLLEKLVFVTYYRLFLLCLCSRQGKGNICVCFQYFNNKPRIKISTSTSQFLQETLDW